jgi:hypothetical protein
MGHQEASGVMLVDHSGAFGEFAAFDDLGN